MDKDGLAADSGAASTTDGGLDINKAVDDIGASLGFGGNDDNDADDGATDAAADADGTADTNVTTDAATDTKDSAAATGDDAAATGDDAAAAAAATKREPPASIPKDKHALWATLNPEQQDFYALREKQMLAGLEQYKGDAGYGKSMRGVVEPYTAFINSQGIDAPGAVKFLLNAHYTLSTAAPEVRRMHFAKLAQSYGIDAASLAAAEGADAGKAVDPAVAELRKQFEALTNGLTAREQKELSEKKASITRDVEAFASDPKNKYFDECSEDIVALIGAGHTLQEAYDKAVYANPATRAKELARIQQESDKAMRERAKKEAEAARRATGSNIRSRDTRKAPTEKVGTMDDTLNATLADIKSRTTH